MRGGMGARVGGGVGKVGTFEYLFLSQFSSDQEQTPPTATCQKQVGIRTAECRQPTRARPKFTAKHKSRGFRNPNSNHHPPPPPPPVAVSYFIEHILLLQNLRRLPPTASSSIQDPPAHTSQGGAWPPAPRGPSSGRQRKGFRHPRRTQQSKSK